MDHSAHHKHLIGEVSEQLEPMLSNSPQAIYVYLDDTHKFCNQKFVDLLGYKSIKEWEMNEFPVSDVDDDDQHKVIEAYGKASDKFEASTVKVAFIKKNGRKVNVSMMMVPLSYEDEVFVLHFLNEEK